MKAGRKTKGASRMPASVSALYFQHIKFEGVKGTRFPTLYSVCDERVEGKSGARGGLTRFSRSGKSGRLVRFWALPFPRPTGFIVVLEVAAAASPRASSPALQKPKGGATLGCPRRHKAWASPPVDLQDP